MRPARKGPENGDKAIRVLQSQGASMRPARKGPENVMVVRRIRALDRELQ